MSTDISTWTVERLRDALEDAELVAAFVPCTGPDYPRQVEFIRRIVADLRRRGLAAGSPFEDDDGSTVRLLRPMEFHRGPNASPGAASSSPKRRTVIEALGYKIGQWRARRRGR